MESEMYHNLLLGFVYHSTIERVIVDGIGETRCMCPIVLLMPDLDAQ